MIFGLLTLLTALLLASMAAWFSIAGLMAIFSGAALSVGAMAGTLEIAKLVTVSWLHRHWGVTNRFLKIYLILAVVVLMFITSLGIFGFLSRAHIEQSLSAGDNVLKISQLDQQISREQSKVQDAVLVITQLDNAVTVLQNNDRISGPNGAVALRLNQEPERASLNSIIQDTNDVIDQLNSQRLILVQQQMQKEVEIGPLKYVAELIYGSERAQENFDQAVRWVIIILVVVFDPLAVALLIAANQTLTRHGVHLEPVLTNTVSAKSPDPAPTTTLPDPIENPAEPQVAQLDLFQHTEKKSSEFESETKILEKIVEVPVEKIVHVEDTQRVDALTQDNISLKKHIKQLQQQLDEPVPVVEKIVEVEKIIPVEVERAASGDLREAARLLSVSEINQQRHTAEDIYNILLKCSEDDVKKRLGFWAVPLPKSPDHDTDQHMDKKYTGKK